MFPDNTDAPLPGAEPRERLREIHNRPLYYLPAPAYVWRNPLRRQTGGYQQPSESPGLLQEGADDFSESVCLPQRPDDRQGDCGGGNAPALFLHGAGADGAGGNCAGIRYAGIRYAGDRPARREKCRGW